MAQTQAPSGGKRWTFLWTVVIAGIAVFYKVYLHNIVTVTFGVGRVDQAIEEFPYECKRLRHPLLESCEDLWLDHKGRKLYAACSNSGSRSQWCPGGNKFNASGRSRTDHISVLNVDKPGQDGLYGLHKLDHEGDLDLNGFDVRETKGGLRFWLVNNRPPVDETGELLDARSLGANSTIEIFDLARGSSKLQHVSTVLSEAVITPNNIAATGDGGFLFTNDHDRKAGTLRELSMLFGGGTLGKCSADGTCHIAAPGYSFPNGIAKGQDGLYYVANSATGKVVVHELGENGLKQVKEISLGIPIDNLSVDESGDIFVAAFPDSVRLMQAMDHPYAVNPPSTILRIRKSSDGEYSIVKVLEDKDGKVLPGSTTAVHDVKSGALFLGGVTSPFIGICHKREE